MMKRSVVRLIVFLLVATFSVFAPFVRASQAAAVYEGRALWVTRWDYSSPEDVRKIIQNAASHYFNIILFQVRGEATVYFRSQIEPWAWELTGDNPSSTGRDPGWDPLATAITYAHQYGIELHAYLNVLPAWQQQTAPPSNHLFTAHRDWLMYDRSGFPMPVTKEIYSFVNPAHPQVKQHLVSLFEEVTRNYKIDGVHLDYIRYPIEYKEADLSYDPVSLSLFKRQMNATPSAAPDQWREFRTSQINDLVRQIYTSVKAIKPNVMVSAACVANRDEGSKTQCQDALNWINNGYVDCLMPMNYTSKLQLFAERTAMYIPTVKRGLVYMGIQADRGDAAMKTQIEYLRQNHMRGFGLFSYENLFPNHQPNATAQMLKDEVFRTPARVSGRRYPDAG